MGRLASLKPRVSYVNTSIAAPLPQSFGFNDARRGTTTERGYGWAWQKKRKRILKRDGYQCVPCKRAERVTPADEVDHIVNLAQGGSDDDSNLQSICGACHAEKTKGEAAGGGGKSRGS